MHMKRLAPILVVPLVYALLSALLLVLPLNEWFGLHAWYAISWPSSHLFAGERLPVQVAAGCGQYTMIATAWVLLFNRRREQRG